MSQRHVPAPRKVLLQGFRGNGNELDESVKQFPLNGAGRIGRLLSGVQFSTIRVTRGKERWESSKYSDVSRCFQARSRELPKPLYL